MKYDWTKLPTPSKDDVNLEHEMVKNEVSKNPDALFCSSPTSSSDDFRFASALFCYEINFGLEDCHAFAIMSAVLTSCVRHELLYRKLNLCVCKHIYIHIYTVSIHICIHVRIYFSSKLINVFLTLHIIFTSVESPGDILWF